MDQQSNATLKALVRPSAAPSETSKTSGELSESTLQKLADLMGSTRDYFPGATISDGTAAEYAKDWINLVARFGMERFTVALAMARRYRLEQDGATVPRQFFPMPSEIEEFISTKTTSPCRAVTDLDCSDCKGSGWKYKAGTRDVERCHCRRLVKG